MPEPFKNNFSVSLIEKMAQVFQSRWPDFDAQGFVAVASESLNTLELKERSNQIAQSLCQFLPEDFEQSSDLIAACLGPFSGESISPEPVASLIDAPESVEGLSGWAIMPMVEYVSRMGMGDVSRSLETLKALTKRFTSEFGIRPFLAEKESMVLPVLSDWCADPCHHVRRLVSEGTRPRLPWGMQLKQYVADPRPILPLLEHLKDDPSEYVRRSVANNLNDIAKDHPDLVVEIGRKWLRKPSKNMTRLVRHGCRTLLKQGHPDCLALFGYHPPVLTDVQITVLTPQVEVGKDLLFSVSFTSGSDHSQSLMIDYVVHHQKANGKTSGKVFKWKQVQLAQGASLQAQKKHAFKIVTTRTFYPGEHELEIVINGHSVGRVSFDLLVRA